jgi:hypothetical protein
LVLIPATVDGVPFTLNLLGELIQRPNNAGHRTEYRVYGVQTNGQIGEQSPPRSYWVLMTRDVLPGSLGKAYAAQKELVAGYASRESVPYELPSALEAATAILLHHAREGERLFGAVPAGGITYTRCQEMVMVDKGRHPVIVGGFSSGGLDVHHYDLVTTATTACPVSGSSRHLALGSLVFWAWLLGFWNLVTWCGGVLVL